MDHESNSRPANPLTQFSLRSLLIVMMLGAAYGAGWISHREWNRRHLSETISGALQAVLVHRFYIPPFGNAVKHS